jgi:hypothetical protein
MTDKFPTMNPPKPERSLPSILWVRLRYWFASRLVTLAWVFWFFMAKGAAASIVRTARRVAPEAERGKRFYRF